MIGTEPGLCTAAFTNTVSTSLRREEVKSGCDFSGGLRVIICAP